MITRPRLLPDLREPRVVPRLLAALAAGVVAGVAVAIPAVPVPVAVVVVGLALAVIVPLGRTGRAHLAVDPDLPPEPEDEPRPLEVVRQPRLAEEIEEYRAEPRPVRSRPYDDPLLATAEDTGVYQPRHSRELCDADTTMIPAVTP